MKNKLTGTDQVSYSLKSMVDDFGRVFFYDNRVFREISNSKKEYCLELINSELFLELANKKIIPNTKISNEFSSDKLILEHERVLETLQHEWSFQMYKDAALMVIELNQTCNKYGYELKDAHTLNVLFKNGSPVFIDFGSISKKASNIENNWTAYDEFLYSFFTPLLFWSNNKHYIVRKLLESNFHRMVTIPAQTLEKSGLYHLIGLSENFNFKVRGKIFFVTQRKFFLIDFFTRSVNFLIGKIFKRKGSFFKYELNEIKLKKIFPQKEIKNFLLNLDNPNVSSQWKGYHSNYYNQYNDINYSYRFKKLLEIIQQNCDVKSVIDLAGNEGYFSILLSKKEIVDRIILADYDENAIDRAYLNIKELGISNITPVLLNFMFTSDLFGTSKRLKSDLVVALAVTHHLILTAKYSLSTIFERLAMFSNGYVMVEFMPLGLWSIESRETQNLPDWYTVDWFREEFKKNFDLILEEQTEENRIVFLGKLL